MRVIAKLTVLPSRDPFIFLIDSHFEKLIFAESVTFPVHAVKVCRGV